MGKLVIVGLGALALVLGGCNSKELETAHARAAEAEGKLRAVEAERDKSAQELREKAKETESLSLELKGLKEKAVVVVYSDGAPFETCEVRMGSGGVYQRHGDRVFGKAKIVLKYEHGRLADQKVTLRTEGGEKLIEGEVEKGRRNGTWTYFDGSGRASMRQDFDFGKPRGAEHLVEGTFGGEPRWTRMTEEEEAELQQYDLAVSLIMPELGAPKD